MKILYTKHAKKKFKDLETLGFKLSKNYIEQIINKPLHIDNQEDYPKIIISGKVDERHVIRVVCKKDRDIITVITFYPAKKGRYFHEVSL